jgi:hypothetical protein
MSVVPELPEPEDARVRIWERQRGEPGRWYALFVEYVGTNSLRQAVARLAVKNGHKPPRRVSGAAWQAAIALRFRERRDAFVAYRAEREMGALETKRRAARARRVAQLDKLESVFTAHLEAMQPADLVGMPPHRLVESVLRLHADEREELRDRPADDSAHADENEGPLPSIESRIRPPEPATPDHEPDLKGEPHAENP